MITQTVTSQVLSLRRVLKEMLQENEETNQEQSRHSIQEIRNSIQERREGDFQMITKAIWGQQTYSKPREHQPTVEKKKETQK